MIKWLFPTASLAFKLEHSGFVISRMLHRSGINSILEMLEAKYIRSLLKHYAVLQWQNVQFSHKWLISDYDTADTLLVEIQFWYKGAQVIIEARSKNEHQLILTLVESISLNSLTEQHKPHKIS